MDLPNEPARQAQAVAFQAAADVAYQHHGQRAPMRVAGEDVEDYRRRLLMPMLQYCDTWKAVNLNSLPASALAVCEGRVYAEAIAAAQENVGPLREVSIADGAGRRVTRFYGDPEGCWGAFTAPVRHVVGWRTR